MPRRVCTIVDVDGQIISGDGVATTPNDEGIQPSTVGVRKCGVTTSYLEVVSNSCHKRQPNFCTYVYNKFLAPPNHFQLWHYFT